MDDTSGKLNARKKFSDERRTKRATICYTVTKTSSLPSTVRNELASSDFKIDKSHQLINKEDSPEDFIPVVKIPQEWKQKKKNTESPRRSTISPRKLRALKHSRDCDSDEEENEKKSTSEFFFNPLIEENTDCVGEYLIGGELGRGGFGAVFKGLHMQTGKFVAIKKIPILNCETQTPNTDKILQEVEILKGLDHPNIVKFINLIEKDNHYFLIFEYIENGSLKDILQKFGNFPESLAKVYMIQILHGLKYLHSKNIAHRDIKAANILITKEGVCKLADFGLASSLNSSTKVAGSPFWMAPELFETEIPSLASDIWSFGCTIYELITGYPPFWDLGPLAAVYHIVDREVEIPRNMHLSAEFEVFLKECFKKDPSCRPSAAQLLCHPWCTSLTPSSVLKQSGNFKLMTTAIRSSGDYHKKKPPSPVSGSMSPTLGPVFSPLPTGNTSPLGNHNNNNKNESSMSLRSKRSSMFSEDDINRLSHDELKSAYLQLLKTTDRALSYSEQLEKNLAYSQCESITLAHNLQIAQIKEEEINKKMQNVEEKIQILESNIQKKYQSDAKFSKLIYHNQSFSSFVNVKKGVLKFKRIGETIWKKRYVVLKNDFLFLFKSYQDAEEPREVIWLNNVKIIPLGVPFHLTFELVARSKHYYFLSANEQIMITWMKALSFFSTWYQDTEPLLCQPSSSVPPIRTHRNNNNNNNNNYSNQSGNNPNSQASEVTSNLHNHSNPNLNGSSISNGSTTNSSSDPSIPPLSSKSMILTSATPVKLSKSLSQNVTNQNINHNNGDELTRGFIPYLPDKYRLLLKDNKKRNEV